MDPVTLVLVPGLVGGAAFALVAMVRRFRRPDPAGIAPPFRPEEPITNMYNISGVRVAGVGGLGLLAMATAVAWNVPMIGLAVTLGALLGVALAIGLILYARNTGPMPSSGKGIGATTVLPLRDGPQGVTLDGDAGDDLRREVVLVPVH